MPTITTSTLSAPIQQSFFRKLLLVPTANFNYKRFSLIKKMPAHGGDTSRSRRYNPLLTAKVPLGNSGMTPPSQNLTALDIDARLSFYGTWLQLNEQVQLLAQDPVLNEATIRLGVSMRQTEDELTREVLVSTGSVINCTSGANGDTITELTRPDINGVTAALADANAMTVSDLIEGEDKFGSAPVRDAYWCMASTKLIGDIDACIGFTAKAQYPTQQAVLRSEYGAVANVRFVLSSISSSTPVASGLGRTVYNNIVTGMQSYSNISVDEYNAKLIYRSPMYNDPLAQNCTLGWKMAECPVILNDALLVNLRCTRSI